MQSNRYRIMIPGTLDEFMAYIERQCRPYRLRNGFSPQFGYLEYKQKNHLLNFLYMPPWYIRGHRAPIQVTLSSNDHGVQLDVFIRYSLVTSVLMASICLFLNLGIVILSLYAIFFMPDKQTMPIFLIISSYLCYIFISIIAALRHAARLGREPFDHLVEGYF